MDKKFEKLPSLSIFFCFMNDEGTVEKAITQAFDIGQQVSKKLEVIAIHGGASKDRTWQKIQLCQRKFPSLKVLNCVNNTEGFAVIKNGFKAASKAWVFYTDGDLQYDLSDLRNLVACQQKTHVDVVNGYKSYRGDSFFRTWFGEIYRRLTQHFFHFPIRDLDCDFRLIRASKLHMTHLTAQDSSILADLISQLQIVGATFAEIPVSHHEREYGKSNYTLWQLTSEKIYGDWKIYARIKKNRSHL